MSWSPGGALLAAAGSDGKVLWWDVSEWTKPRPFSLKIISGDDQQGPPGAVLPQPLVVEVRDQYGDLLPGAAVTFKVTAGEGQLSGPFTVEHATTDADGRAGLTLTLGPFSGLNTVEVSIGGRELAVFHAEGVGTAVAELEGDYRTWHLPKAATVRLGKGALGSSDRAVAQSPDGRYLAVASAIGVWLYETATFRPLALLPSAGRVHSVAFALDGTLSAGLNNGQVELWEVEIGERIGTLRHEGWGVTTAFSPDGTTLASWSYPSWSYQGVKLWDVETMLEVHIWGEVKDAISVTFSPDWSRLAAGFFDGTIRLWDVATGEFSATLSGHTGAVLSVAFSPDGGLLASGGEFGDSTVRLWDTATQTEVATLRGHSNEVSSVAFSPDGGTLASAGGQWDPTVRQWDVATGEPIATWEEHAGWVHSVTFSRDGSLLVSAASDGTVLLRDLESGNTTVLSGHESVSSMAFSRDGAIVASGSPEGSIKLWDALAQTRIAVLDGHQNGVTAVAFSPDGALLASVGDLDPIKLWDVATRKQVGIMGPVLKINTVSFSSPDGGLLATGSWDGKITLWDVETRKQVAALEGHISDVETVSFSPDGATLASGGRDNNTVELWDVATRERIATLETGNREVYSLLFSPDGAILASGGWNASGGYNTVELWDVGTQTKVAALDGGISLSFSPDGDILASGSSSATGNTIKLWDMETREQFATLEGHADWVRPLRFSDGTTLASGSDDGTILLWDLQLLQPRPHSLTKVSGLEQHGQAGAALSQPFVVLVQDQNGAPSAGATVTFAVTAGEGALSVETVATDADGRAATTLTLGPEPGPNTVEALVAGLDPVTFSAVGSAIPHSLTKLSGRDQQVAAGTALTEPFVVEVKDRKGQPLEGARVTFAVTAGGGTLSATTDTTDADGRASTTLTLGPDPGRNTVVAKVADLKPVIFSAAGQAIPKTLTRISGDGQQGTAGAALIEPFVVEVRDQNDDPLEGTEVTFAVTAGGGTLSTTTATTDANGRAAVTLTLGSAPGAHTVEARVAGLESVTFTAAAETTPDFDGDGETGFSDFFLFAEAFGGSDPRFDLDGDGSVGFADFFLLSDHFADPARGKLLALAREMIGLPDGPQLLQNAPNPFNSETVISWFLLRPGPLRVEVFSLTGAAGGGAARGAGESGSPSRTLERPRRSGPPPGQRGVPVPAGDGRARPYAQAHPAAVAAVPNGCRLMAMSASFLRRRNLPDRRGRPIKAAP